MKIGLLSPFGKKKRNVTDIADLSDIDQSVAAGDSRDSELDNSTGDKMNSEDKESGGLGVFDDSDHDEIFDDEDDDDVADDQNSGSPLDISEFLAAGASAIAAPIQKVIHKDKDNNHKAGAGASDDNSSDGDSDGDDTDGDDEDDHKKKSGHGSESGEDYTDDEDEGEDGYKTGGYHRVKVGEVYNQR
jgi:hypothetical protein